MAKLKYQFGIPFEYDVPKETMKLALKKEIEDSFGIEKSKNTNAMLEYLVEVFYSEFLDYLQDEMQEVFETAAKHSYGGDT